MGSEQLHVNTATQETLMLPYPVRLVLSGLAVALTMSLAPAPAAAQSMLTFAQMQQRYPNLPPNQIQICDHSGDGLFSRGEQACVSSINDVMMDNR
jgi:hypothetical protein